MAIYGDILDALVGERYRVVTRLGAGAFGEVFQARHESFGIALRTVALKLFTKAYVSRENAATVFREALLLESLAAEARTRGDAVHLVTIHDIGILRDYQYMPYVAMEYVDGGTLSQHLRQDGLPLQTVMRYIRDICAGLQLAHEATPVAIIHRDLKPDNVLVTRSGFVKVADFGLAINRYEAFLQGAGAGTISYAAPESRGKELPSPAYDIYALGVMMVEMLLGTNPLAIAIQRAMDAGNPVAPALDRAQDLLAHLQDPATGLPLTDSLTEVRMKPSFHHVLQQCLAPSPAARFSGASALDSALQACQGESHAVIEKPVETAREEIERLIASAHQYLRWGEIEQAQSLFARVRHLDPRDQRVCFGLSEVYEKQGRLHEAIREQEQGVQWGRTQENTERLRQLQVQVQTGTQPTNASARKVLGNILARKENR